MTDRGSRFRLTPVGRGWRDFWFETPGPVKRFGERMWTISVIRRIARFFDRATEGPVGGGEYPPSPGRGYQFLSDDDYSIDDDQRAVELYRLRNGRETPPSDRMR